MSLHRRTILHAAAAVAVAPLFAPHVARAAARTIRIGHNNSESSSLQEAAVAFGKYASEKSDSRIKVEIYPNSQLGDDSQVIRAVADGTLDMSICAIAILGVYSPDLELSELPYLFKDTASARSAMSGNLGAHYTEELQKASLTTIGWGENGLRHITANKPIRTVADMKDLKIRVQNNKLQVTSFTGLGAAASPLSFNELPEALRTGRFEAEENPISVLVANDFIVRAQAYLSLTGHVYSAYAVLFSSDVLEDMTPVDRAIVSGGGVMAAKATRDFSDKAAEVGIKNLKAAGMTVVTDVDNAGFRKAMDGISDQLAAVAGAESINRIRGLVA